MKNILIATLVVAVVALVAGAIVDPFVAPANAVTLDQIKTDSVQTFKTSKGNKGWVNFLHEVESVQNGAWFCEAVR